MKRLVLCPQVVNLILEVGVEKVEGTKPVNPNVVNGVDAIEVELVTSDCDATGSCNRASS